MKNNHGVTLVELVIASMVGVILLVATVLILVFIFKMQMIFRQRNLGNMSWVAANEHLKKQVHGSSYVKIPAANMLELYNYNGVVPTGRYTSTSTGTSNNLYFDTDKITFENVAATFEQVDTKNGKIVEVRVNYTSPTQLASALVLKCGVDVKSDTWARTYGSALFDIAYSVQQTQDGGYIIAGYTQSASGSNMYVIKTDPDGDSSAGHGWQKTYSANAYGNIAYSVQQTTDGGYIIAGYTGPSGVSSFVYLIKTDSTGDDSTGAGGWSRTYQYPGSYHNVAFSVQQTFDSSGNPDGYIVAGDTMYKITPTTSNLDWYVFKTDKYDGAPVWQKNFVSPLSLPTRRVNIARSVQQTRDTSGIPTGYIVAGFCATTEIMNGPTAACLIKTGLNGDPVWPDASPIPYAKLFTFPGNANNYGYSVQQTFNSSGDPDGYIIVGATRLTQTSPGNVYLIKTDSDGNLQWQKTFGGVNVSGGECVRQTTDGGYIIAGSTNDGTYGAQAYLIKTDSNGDLSWPPRTFGGTGTDYATSVQQTTDGGYIMTGYTDSYGTGGDVYVIKTDSEGNCPDAKTPIPDTTAPTPG